MVTGVQTEEVVARTFWIPEGDRPGLSIRPWAADGGLSNRRTFAEGVGPDGICVDAGGAVWTSPGEGDACVRVREVARHARDPKDRLALPVRGHITVVGTI